MSIRRVRVFLLRVSFACLTALALLFGSPGDSDSMLGFALQWTGYLFLLVGLGIRLWSILYIGHRKSSHLVKTGPYSLCRNPLYVGTVFLAIGAGLSFENLLMCAFALVVVVPLHYVTVRAEEAHLRELFGQEYLAYCRNVPRFLPQWSRYRGDSPLRLSPRALRRALLDSVGILMVPPLAQFVDLLQDRGIVHVLWTWP